MADRRGHQRQVQAVLQHRLQQVVGGTGLELQFDLRVVAVEGGQQARQAGRRRGLHGADAQHAGWRLLAAHRGLGLAGQGQQAAGVVEQALALGRDQ